MAIEIEQLEDAINETERTDGQQSIVDWAARCFLAQQKAPEQDDDVSLVDDITRIVREADDLFKKSGGSSRHWVRDWFLPLLNKSGFVMQRPPHPTVAEQVDLEALKSKMSYVVAEKLGGRFDQYHVIAAHTVIDHIASKGIIQGAPPSEVMDNLDLDVVKAAQECVVNERLLVSDQRQAVNQIVKAYITQREAAAQRQGVA